MLVTIAIIAILAQILIPALVTAKKKSREVKCMSNMKQTVSAINLYAEDFGYYPYGNTASGFCFKDSIKAYLWPFSNEDSPILECPDALHPERSGEVWVSYAVHPLIMPDFTTTPPATALKKVGTIRRISYLMLITESPQKLQKSCYPTLKSIPGILTDGNSADSEKAIEGDFDKHDEDGVDANEGWVRFRHLYKRANTGFADGHVTNVKIGSIIEGNVKTNY